MFDYSPINTYPCTPPGGCNKYKKKLSITHYCHRKADDNTTPNMLYVGKTIVIRNAQKNAQIHKNTQKNKNCEQEMFLFFYLPTARPDRSVARQPMLQSFPRAP